ncbi:MAG: SRPBCC family protein, partial [Acidimicrobiaceae bacterium]|nr:SRPBCC family protein [Acidimicrobiaceae bacterium]
MTSTYSSEIEVPVAEAFAWHERPGALIRLLPPWLPVGVAEEAASLRDGKAVLRLPGGVRWVAQHGGYDPPHRFVDELVSLPLRWRHTHDFAAVTGESTRLTDTVDTPVPGRVLHAGLAYGHRQLADDLAAQRVLKGLKAGPMTVAITGSSGLI